MTEETTTVEKTEETTETEKTQEAVPYERFQQANKKAKEAAERTKTLEKEMADLRSQMEDRETAGLPELERERKRAEQLEKRASDAEKLAADNANELTRSKRERWVVQAAKDFIDPDDAARFVDLDDIEDADQAERAVKRVAKSKPHLLKSEDPKLPGRVLENGRTATTQKKTGGIDLDAEAQMISDELAKFLKNRQSTPK